MKTTIECTNCGGGGDLQFWITVGALAIAFLALLMNYVQFREFLRRSKARARFKVAPGLLNDGVENAVIRSDATVVAIRFKVGIKNVGNLAAGETVVNVLVPQALSEPRWCDPGGEEVEQRPTLAETSERLEGFDGTEYEARYLSKTLPRVGTKPSHVLYFIGDVQVPTEGRVEIPVRVKVQADEIPDDVEEYSEGIIFWVERATA